MSALAERDQLRIELGRLGNTFRERQDAVDEQIAEVREGRFFITDSLRKGGEPSTSCSNTPPCLV